MPPKPPTTAKLAWLGDLKFAATFSRATATIDSAGLAGPSPVDALAGALVGCMSADVVHILTRGRHELKALQASLVADRAQDGPHRIVRAALHFTIEGEVPREALDRAITLSREKYCSVWHSMREDIDFVTTFEIVRQGSRE